MIEQSLLDKLVEISGEILRERYSSAEFAFLAGSYVRGEATAFSDLDIVVIFGELPNALRESFYFQGFPVETFIHTPETLNYFFELDAKSGTPMLAQMVSEGVEVPGKNDLSQELKVLAEKSLGNPPVVSEEELRDLRYGITNLVDDIREPRSKAELTAAGVRLYEELAEYYLRTNNLWSAKGKTIPRVLQKHDTEFYQNFTESFERFFVSGKFENVIELAEKLLEKNGGFLFDGVRLDAPPEWKKNIN